MTIGAFAVLMIVEKNEKSGEIAAFAGLYQRSPLLAVAMTVILVSLAGIPVTAGFFGKFYILINALASEKLWIALIMIATTVVSYFYYFEFIRQMYFRPSPRGEKLAIPGLTAAVILVAVVGTIGLGIFPQSVLQFLGGIQWDGAFVQRDRPVKKNPAPWRGFSYGPVRTKCFAFFTAIGYDGVERVAKGVHIMDGAVSLGLVGLINIVMTLAGIGFSWWILMNVRLDVFMKQPKGPQAKALMIVLSIVWDTVWPPLCPTIWAGPASSASCSDPLRRSILCSRIPSFPVAENG